MKISESIIALIGLSGTIVSIFGGFLLSIGYGINEAKRKIVFEMELLHKEIIQKKEILPSGLSDKIRCFEEKAHLYSIYLQGDNGFEYLPYTTMVNHSNIRLRLKGKPFLAKKIRNLYGFIVASPDFETFARWTNLSEKWKKSKDFRTIYEFLVTHQSIERYSISLQRQVSEEFLPEERAVYEAFIESTKKEREQLWNHSILKPTLKNQSFYFVGLFYLMAITSIGIINPFLNENVDVQLSMLSICILTIVYVGGMFVMGLTPKTSWRMRREIRKHHW